MKHARLALSKAGPFGKALAVGLLMLAAVVGDAQGVETGLDVDGLWEQLGAIVVPPLIAYLVPAPGYARARLPEGGA